jgi:hypothetical protein
VKTARTTTLCPWCSAEAHAPVPSDEGHNYVICARHQRDMLAHYLAARRPIRIPRRPSPRIFEPARPAA